MNDWISNLSPEEQREWDKFVRHCQDDLIPKMSQSAFMISLCPLDGELDVKFSVELGMAIMLDKPIIAVITPGTAIPEKLEKVADYIVSADIRTPEGQRKITDAIMMIMEVIGDKEEK